MSDSVVKNVLQLPSRWYGKHISPGVAEYRPDGEPAYRILLNEQVIRDMDNTFDGKPVYVQHVDDVNLANLQTKADGYVVKSFFNAADSSHWVEFLVVSDAGREAVKKGFKLSNAYKPMSFAGGGVSKGVDYQKELMSAEYEHLALVQTPRYEDSVILSPEAFKKYNEDKLSDLKRISNSIKEKKSMFDLFKRTKIENADLSEAVVKLPLSGKEMTIEQLINAVDKAEAGEHKSDGEKPKMSEEKNPKEEEKQGDKPEAKDSAPQMANEDHHVAMGEGTMSVKDLKARHDKMQDCMNVMSEMASKPKANDEQMDGGEKQAAKDEKSADKTEKNDEEMDGGEKQAADQLKESDKTKKNNFFDTLKNAKNSAFSDYAPIDFGGVARGKARYGSGK